MHLTKEEGRLLRGEYGTIVQKAIKILVTLGDVFGAERLGKIESAHISGISYENIGESGLNFLEEWASKDVIASVPTTINPCGMDMERWQEFKISKTFAEKQTRIVDSFEKMKITKSLTCTPYLVGNKPKIGEHIAWAESSAIVFANSVLGARTNREGGPSALASAITGRTPIFGYHLDEGRAPTHEIHVKEQMKGPLEHSILGYHVGKELRQCVPLFKGLGNPNLEELKALSAGLAASGAVAIYHIQNVTPEEKAFRENCYERINVERDALSETAWKISTEKLYDHICIGCPHCSLKEIAGIADRVANRKLKRKLWIFTSRFICEKAKRLGYFEAIEKAGGKVISDTCMVVAPMKEMGVQGMITNSCKAAHYVPNTCKVPATLKSVDECLKAAFE